MKMTIGKFNSSVTKLMADEIDLVFQGIHAWSCIVGHYCYYAQYHLRQALGTATIRQLFGNLFVKFILMFSQIVICVSNPYALCAKTIPVTSREDKSMFIFMYCVFLFFRYWHLLEMRMYFYRHSALPLVRWSMETKLVCSL